jgi:signal transduction histidine kinase
MTGVMRLVLASSALLIIYLDPSEPDRFVALTYSTLVCYTLYSGIICGLTRRVSPSVEAIQPWLHWVDVAWYLVLIALSSGTSSIFFFFFFFSILVASFQQGFRSGFWVALVSSLLFTIIGYATSPPGPAFELNRFLLRPIYLLVLGYMMAYWGENEIKAKRRLELLKDVSLLSNPRFGADRTMAWIMHRLLLFYQADVCLLVTEDPETAGYLLRRADRRHPQSAAQEESIERELAGQLLKLPATHTALVTGGQARWNWLRRYYGYDLGKREPVSVWQEACEDLASRLDADSFVTVPLDLRQEKAARFYVIMRTRKTGNNFENSDVHLLIQVFEQVMPVLDNIRLVDRLASDAAEAERQRIARNIHDSVIQPYLGLQLGLNSLRQKLAASLGEGIEGQSSLTQALKQLSDRIERLIEMTRVAIADLRSYVSDLKQPGEPGGNLLPSVRRYAGKFAEATGIAVEVRAESDVQVNDRLAAETFQMITEGLSNIRRHTDAKKAAIGLECRGDRLILGIESTNPQPPGGADFTPRSISERSRALGGRTRVEQQGDRTLLIVEVPL